MAQQKDSTLGIRCTSLQRRNLGREAGRLGVTESEVVRRWLDALGNDVATGLEPDEPLDYDGWLRIIERRARQGDSTALARLAEIRGWNRQGGQDLHAGYSLAQVRAYFTLLCKLLTHWPGDTMDDPNRAERTTLAILHGEKPPLPPGMTWDEIQDDLDAWRAWTEAEAQEAG